MRMTISIPDELLAEAERRARMQGATAEEVICAALRRGLLEAREGEEHPDLPIFRRGTGARPGLDLTSNREVLEALDEGVPLDKRR